MKKVIFTLFLTVFFVVSANSQDYETSLGLRAGVPYGATIKHFLDKYDALEGIVAARYQGLIITGLWERERWTGHYPGLNWYWGAGAHVGFWNEGTNPNIEKTYNGAVFGVDGVVGLEYTFDDFPLNLSLDILPTVNLFGSTGWGGINGALSIRYVF
ncbi:MAG: hypothetical protein ABR974_04750 [Bacteroidales bacterium]|jgi:hypothetical protein